MSNYIPGKLSGVDVKKAVIVVFNDIPIIINKDGEFYIDRDLNRDKMSPIIDCDMQIDQLITDNIITYKQKILLYESWGTSKNIIISTIAELLVIDKALAKKLIILGQRYGVLEQSWNNAWKIKSVDMKVLLLEKVKLLAENPIESPKLTMKELRDRAYIDTQSSEESPEEVVQKTEPIKTPTRTVIPPKKKPSPLHSPVPGKKPLN